MTKHSAIPASKSAALSSGEFVGLVADNPDEKIKLKIFHAEIINDADKPNDEMRRYKDIPVVSNVSQQQVLDLYLWLVFPKSSNAYSN